MRKAILLALVLGSAGCAPLPPAVIVAPDAVAMRQDAPPLQDPDSTARAFVAVVSQIEPVAEALCRARTRAVNCDFQIVVDARPGLPANAFQTLDRAGRPVVGFTLALIADARNADELAFTLGHEAAHHIAGHLPRQQQEATTGAILAGVMAEMGGADAATIRSMQQMGAAVAARRYSQQFELEADALGTEIAWRAGYDPVRGSAFFSRLPDPGDRFLGTHPPNGQRLALVRATYARLLQGY